MEGGRKKGRGEREGGDEGRGKEGKKEGRKREGGGGKLKVGRE